MSRHHERPKKDGQSLLPSDEQLVELLAKAAPALGSRRVLARKPTRVTARVATEVLTVLCQNERRERVLAKHGMAVELPNGDACGGVAYEAAVHEHVLADLTLDAPRFVGACLGSESITAHLFLEALPAPGPASPAGLADAEARLAARWLGAFHRAADRLIERRVLPLRRHPRAVFLRGIDRVRDFHRRTRAGRSWLPQLLQRDAGLMEPLLGGEVTVVHGSFRAAELVFEGSRVRPLNWQCAALGAGEVDLAALLCDQGDRTIDRCVAEYRAARWPEGVPADHGERWSAARLHVMLGRFVDRPLLDDSRERLDSLRNLVEREGLV